MLKISNYLPLKLGIVEKVYIESDDNSRVADIRTQNVQITRPITKLVALKKI